MGLPSKKRTPRSKRERNAHSALKPIATSKCEKCEAPTLAHRACTSCGEYRGKKVVNVEKRATRRLKRVKSASK
jgi:large subunit ribosomal protein L32